MKKFWLTALNGALSLVIFAAVSGVVTLIKSEVKFHVQVNERLARIETALKIQTTNTTTYADTRP